jgi:phage regulator Rha-like protein
MQSLPTIQINDISLDQLTYRDVPVVTFQQIAEVHDVSVKTVMDSFHRHKGRFALGKHYFRLDFIEASELLVRQEVSPNGIILFTEKGYLLLTKPMRDQKSWEVQERMVDEYFTLKTALTAYSDLIAIQNTLVKLAEVRDAQKLLETEQRAQDQRIIEQSQRISEATALAQKAFLAQMTMTLRYYRYVEHLEHQLPDTLLNAFGRHLTAYCLGAGIPVGKEPVADKQYGVENRYPVAVIQDILPGWLLSQQGQEPLEIDA